MASEILNAIKQIAEEKGISAEAVLETIESALAAAYRKDFGNKNQNIFVDFEPKTGGVRVYDIKEVVENPPSEEEWEEIKEKAEEEGGEEELKRFNPKTQIGIDEAKKIKKGIKIGDELKVELEVPGEFGRMAAQTAKQVIVQKLREVERQTTFDEFKNKEGTIITGTVQRREGKVMLVDLGRATGLMLPEDQMRGEYYGPGSRLKFYVNSVNMTTKGPEILVSRTSAALAKKLFEIEIPEIEEGSIEIKAVSREAGSRSKIAVESKDENIDPIGSCVGQRGTRVQTIISELGGEKIDIIKWDENPEKFIINALSPAKISSVELKEKEKSALVSVKADQLSLAIGKGGQNVRLAAKLTGWKIDIAEAKDDGSLEKVGAGESDEKTAEKEPKKEEIGKDRENKKEKDPADSSKSDEQAVIGSEAVQTQGAVKKAAKKKKKTSSAKTAAAKKENKKKDK